MLPKNENFAKPLVPKRPNESIQSTSKEDRPSKKKALLDLTNTKNGQPTANKTEIKSTAQNPTALNQLKASNSAVPSLWANEKMANESTDVTPSPTRTGIHATVRNSSSQNTSDCMELDELQSNGQKLDQNQINCCAWTKARSKFVDIDAKNDTDSTFCGEYVTSIFIYLRKVEVSKY